MPVIASALDVFVCLCRHCIAASVFGYVPIFTVLARFLFTLLFRIMLCRSGTGVETVSCWHSMMRFEHGSIAFTLVFRSMLC